MTTSDKKTLHLEKTKRVEFLLEREFIEQHVASGYTAKAIWKGLFEAGRITMSYQMFLVLVRRHIQAPAHNPSMNINNEARPAKALDQGVGPTPRSEPLRLKRDDRPPPSFNISTIGKEHLLEPYTEENRNE